MPTLNKRVRQCVRAASYLTLIAAITLSAASSVVIAQAPTATTPAPQPPAFQAVSLLGDTLRDFPLSAEIRAKYEVQLAEAQAAYDRAPANPDSIIWFGRRLAYVGRVRDAIEVYSRGIALHPENPWLYRHRGHRYITLREFDRAIADLERAAKLVEGKPDEPEPDGQPNAQNIPIGTLHSNIDYHLALAYYLTGEYDQALPVYKRELNSASNDDRRVSVTYWYYLSLRKLGQHAEASALLRSVTREMNVLENDTYRDLLLLFKREISPDSLLRADTAAAMSVANATVGYGLASWHLLSGRRGEAERLLRRTIAGGQWPAFGYIAAEAELSRPRGLRRYLRILQQLIT